MEIRNFNPIERQAIEDVLAHQIDYEVVRGFLPQNIPELLICISGRRDREIDRQIGAPDGVHLSDVMKEEAANNDCSYFHNHPSGGSLSFADWRVIATPLNGSEITAINRRGSIFRGSIVRHQHMALKLILEPRGVPQTDLGPEIGEVVFAPLWAMFLADPLNGEDPTPYEQAISWMWSHLVNERLEEKGYVEYLALLAPDDYAQLRDYRIQGLINAAKAEIARRIP